MRFSELEDVRVKLDDSGRKEFWHRVDEFGGIKNFSEAFEISSSKIYNWKSKESFIPIELVKKVFGNESSQHVEAYKGAGRSKVVQNPVFPIPENDELLTRVDCSVTTNKNRIPLYQASDVGLVKRFSELLQIIGDVPFKVYERDVFELRYPKYVHKIFSRMSHDESLETKVDEDGVFTANKILLDGEQIDSAALNEIYHRDKRLKLALMKGDDTEIANLMIEEKEKVRTALNQA